MALPYLIFDPASTDLAAQTFRADLWREHGWVLWNDAWYSGHLVPGYSLLYPPLGALVGPRVVGVLAAAAAAAAFAALLRANRPGPSATLAGLWFALGAGALIYTGRITFMLGLAFGILAILALRRLPLAALLAALAALGSPVAGLFTALAGAALILGGRVREGVVLVAGASVATLVLVFTFPTGGSQPFGFESFWWGALACSIAVVVIPADLRTLRIGIAIYALLLVALFVVPTPIGSNAPRLGALLLGPLAALALLERRPRLLAIVALPLLYWQLAAPVGDLVRGTDEPATEAAFYEPLLAQLQQRTGGAPVRVEIPASQERWEAVYVAERFPLARGWLRQLESSDVDDFAEGTLTPATYREWLTRHGVSYVALSSATLDYISQSEAELLKGDLPYLRKVYYDDDWTLWEVLPPDGGEFRSGEALADGGARVTELRPDGFTVDVPGPGSYRLAIAWTSYFEIEGGPGGTCVSEGADGSTEVSVADAGEGTEEAATVDVAAGLSLGGLTRRDRSCAS
ncbi:MAG: hypothetical protein H0V25_02875 [Solirubrobacterales bacterium]|nr:hypothetical protein [Solirubrobacterales bacterium]